MDRKLVTVVRVDKLHKLPQFDNLLLAEIKGWKCLVKKDEFKEGDLGIYFEIDSVLPDVPKFEFMRKYNFRVKTIKMKGVYSQGLLLPLNMFNHAIEQTPLNIGDDLTDYFGVTKYEVPDTFSHGDAKGSFPQFIQMTNAERIQNHPEYFEMIKGKTVYVTEKLDGTSFTAYYRQGEFGVCSRNMEKKLTSEVDTYVNYFKNSILDELLKDLSEGLGGHDVAIQGELIGPGIQKNHYNLKHKELFIFNVFDITEQRYVIYNIPGVPVLDAMNSYLDSESFETYCDILFNCKSHINSDVSIEGLVFTCYDDSFPFGRLIFKALNPEYLLKNNQ